MINNEQINNNFSRDLNELTKLKNMLSHNGEFIILAHGTLLSLDEIQQTILKNGLFATGHNENSSLIHTTNPVDVDSYDISELDEKLQNWPHASNNIVFIKLPLEYFNIYGDHGDRDCTKTRAFMDKVNIDDNTYKYLLDPKFIVGAYNLKSGNILPNPSFETELSNETHQQLQEKLNLLCQELGIELDIQETRRTL